MSFKYLPNLNFVSCVYLLLCSKRCLSFSGLMIESSMLHRHARNFESSLFPVSKLRQVVNVERHSQIMKLAVDFMPCELSSASIRKKICTESSVIFPHAKALNWV